MGELIDPSQIELELFKVGNKLNLSDEYETLPKEVSSRDKDIVWDDQKRMIKNSVKKIFHYEGQPCEIEITPAVIPHRTLENTNISRFPHIREAKIEYAILSIASRKVEAKRNSDSPSGPDVIFVKTSVYEIKKEIVRAINKSKAEELKDKLEKLAREGKKMTAAQRAKYDPISTNHTYNNKEIIESINVLRRTNYKVSRLGGNKHFEFNRLNDFAWDDDGKHIIIELGSRIAKYINSHRWHPIEGHNLIGSSSYYEMRIKDLMYSRFTYAAKGKKYSPSLLRLIEYTSHPVVRTLRNTANKLYDIMIELREVERVELEWIKEGSTVVNCRFHIFPSKYFIESQIKSNKISGLKDKSVKHNGKLIFEPIRESYDCEEDYQDALNKYNQVMKEFFFKS